MALSIIHKRDWSALGQFARAKLTPHKRMAFRYNAPTFPLHSAHVRLIRLKGNDYGFTGCYAAKC